LIALIVNILWNLLLIPIWWTYGAIIATGLARITMTTLLIHYIYQHHQFGIDRYIIFKNILIVFILSTGIYYLRTQYDIFISTDTHRIWNLRILSLISLWYISIIASINHSLILELWHQVRMSYK
jgi:peptidoglycan biosynthesis protein MviN/MurJ (putative lipid II flippase)